ncbi:MAG TPA: hypothetical protein VF712_16155 [Thermoleophilaceae bacterium]
MLALLLALAAPATAAERVWQAPQLVSPDPESTWTNDSQLVHTAAGETVALFLHMSNDWSGPTRVLARVRGADGLLRPVEELTDRPAGCVLDLATDALGNVVASWTLPDGRAQIARRPPGGKFGPPETVSPAYEGNWTPSLAMNARGDVGLVWYRWKDQRTNIQARVSHGGGPFGPIHDITEPEYPPYYGGVSGAMTPDGDLVAVWSKNPDGDGDPRPARVEAATLFARGEVSRVRSLSVFDGWATCPQVLSDLRGRIAALWHEIYDDYCPVYGRTMVARRQAGHDEFDPPEEVPGTRGSVSPGTLAVSDEGRIAVSFSDWRGGHLAVGSFDDPLELVADYTHSSGEAAMAGGDGGEVVFGPRSGADVATSRLRADGSLAPAQDLREDCGAIDWTQLDVNGSGAAAALMTVGSGDLELVVDAPSALAGPLRCDPGQAPGPPREAPPPYVPPPAEPPPAEPPPAAEPPPPDGHAAPEGMPPPPPADGSGPDTGWRPPEGPAPGPAETGFGLAVESVTLSGSRHRPTYRIRVRCGVACSLSAVGLLRGKDGRRVVGATGTASAPDGVGVVKLRFRLPAKLASSRRRKATVRIGAADRHGNVLEHAFGVRL